MSNPELSQGLIDPEPVADVSESLDTAAVAVDPAAVAVDPDAVPVPEQGLDDDLDVEQIVLVSVDNTKISAPKRIFKNSKTIRTMLEVEKDQTTISLPTIPTADINKLIEYLTHIYDETKDIVDKDDDCPDCTDKDSSHLNIKKPITSANMIELVKCQWCVDFSNLSAESLSNLITCANYVDVKPMLDLMCCKVASMMHGKDAEAIRAEFGIVNDFTPEEEAKLKEEAAWTGL